MLLKQKFKHPREASKQAKAENARSNTHHHTIVRIKDGKPALKAGEPGYWKEAETTRADVEAGRLHWQIERKVKPPRKPLRGSKRPSK